MHSRSKHFDQILAELDDKLEHLPDISEIEKGDFQRILHELQNNRIELEMQNDALHMAQIEIDISNSKYLFLYEKAPVGYVILDSLGGLLEFNSTFAEMLGSDIRKNEQTPFQKFLVPQDQFEFLAVWTRFFKNPLGKTLELSLQTSNGPLHVQLVGSVLPWQFQDTEKTKTLFVSIANIDQIKRYESELSLREKRYHSLLQATSDIIWIADKKGRFSEPQPSWGRYTGQFWPEHQEYAWLEMIHSDDRKRILHGWKKAIDQKENYSDEGQIWNAHTKKYHHFHITATPVFDDHKTVLEWVGMLEDREAQYVAKQELIAKEMRTQTILNTIADAIITIDSQGIIETANQETEDIFGYAPDELIGQNVKMLMSKKDQKHHDHYLKNYLKTRIPRIIAISRKVDAIKKDGTVFPVHLAVNEMLIDGELKFTGSLRDITHLEQLESQLRQSQKMEAIGTLAGGIAHDFNNILQGCSLTVEYIQDYPSDEKIPERLETLQRLIQRGATLVQQILQFSKLDNSVLQVINLSETMQDVVKLVQSVLLNTIKMDVTLPDSAILIEANVTQFHQILLNLCSNASHAMTDGKGVLSISLERQCLTKSKKGMVLSKEPKDYAVLSVQDTGVGIKQQDLDHIFDPFFTTKPVNEGTGLGLSVVHGIIQKHSGHIEVESQEGKGTLFRMYFPIVNLEKLEQGPSQEVPIVVDLENVQVLLVDDEIDIASTLSSLLEGLGCSVKTTHSPHEALRWLQQSPSNVDVLITDNMMPNMTGVELIEEALLIHPNLPVILITGFREGIKDLTNSENYRCLPKPFTKQQITQILGELLTISSKSSSS